MRLVLKQSQGQTASPSSTEKDTTHWGDQESLPRGGGLEGSLKG